MPRHQRCSLLPIEGGWSAILRVPATRSDEDWALALLAEDGVLVQPGYFFDLRRRGRDAGDQPADAARSCLARGLVAAAASAPD